MTVSCLKFDCTFNYKMLRFLIGCIFLVLSVMIHGIELDQGSAVQDLLRRKMKDGNEILKWEAMHSWTDLHQPTLPSSYEEDTAFMEHDLIVGGIPGQPNSVSFRQYSGHITVDVAHGRSLFYYFVEASSYSPTSKPLVLWLNGGPGCSSIGIGAMVENGPFGVNKDGKTLYMRHHSWNRVANMLYLESPAGVGFSYSNTSSDYGTTGDLRTTHDSYIFLTKWFKRFPRFNSTEFYIAGESYAGFYIPELVDLILQWKHLDPSFNIHVKGIMVGNGLVNLMTDMKGIFDYLWSHTLISDETHEGLLVNCLGSINSLCMQFENKEAHEIGNIDLSSLNSAACAGPSTIFSVKCPEAFDPCEKNYVNIFLNLPQVQESLHANKTRLAYPWSLCSFMINKSWRDSPSTMLPIYERLISTGLRILLYSGDMDALIPWTSTKYSINELNLTLMLPWKPWVDDSGEVAGYKVEYNEGLTFATVRNAGHEVPRYQPRRAFSLMQKFLEGLL